MSSLVACRGRPKTPLVWLLQAISQLCSRSQSLHSFLHSVDILTHQVGSPQLWLMCQAGCWAELVLVPATWWANIVLVPACCCFNIELAPSGQLVNLIVAPADCCANLVLLLQRGAHAFLV